MTVVLKILLLTNRYMPIKSCLLPWLLGFPPPIFTADPPHFLRKNYVFTPIVEGIFRQSIEASGLGSCAEAEIEGVQIKYIYGQ